MARLYRTILSVLKIRRSYGGDFWYYYHHM
jgi:hypothetical protein